ncbi:MAG: hypothetical protein Q9M37_03855 [Desulfonauticus sp.]|nr:hypothetical protein [Desulfonauticus sp.]
MEDLELKKKGVLLTIDLSFYLKLSGKSNLDPGEIAKITRYWQNWFKHFNAYTLGEPKGYLVLFLNKEVEREIEAAWASSPTGGYELELMARTMLMAAVKEFIPELEQLGCAPVPKVNKNIRRKIALTGLEVKKNGTLSHKYAVFTYYPYKGGCNLCLLKTSCPTYQKLNI